MAAKTNSSIWRSLALILAVLTLAAVACGGDDDDTTSTAVTQAAADGGTDSSDDSGGEVETGNQDLQDDAPAATQAPALDEAAQDGEPDDLGSGGATGGNLTAADLGRKIIFTASVSVEVDDVAASGAQATTIIQDLGGFVFGQSTVGGAEPSSEIVFKVLPDQFNEALARLGEIGELRNQTISTDDVTERVVNLESRIGVAELGVVRLRTAMETAPDLEQFAALEGLLLDRESDLEVMRGQRLTLQRQVDLATITLQLSQDRVENSVALAISAYEGHDQGVSCPNQNIVRAEKGTDVTVCIQVTNTGDQTLSDLVLTDTVLDISADTTLIPVFDSLEELPPGQSAMVAFQLNPKRNLRPRTRVSGIPTDGVSSDPVGPSVSTTQNYEINVFEPDTNAGFGDGFGAAKSILAALWIAVTVSLGFLILMIIPLLILLAIFWQVRKRWEDRKEQEAVDRELLRQQLQPPAPAATPTATSAGPDSDGTT